jgi:hypothetical protein
MSLADHPEVGPVASAILSAIQANMKPGDSPEDVALICCAVASALIVESAALAGKPDTVQYRLERAQAFLESMVDFHVARQEAPAAAAPLAAELRRAVTKVRHVTGEARIIAFPRRVRPGAAEGGGDVA